MLRREKAAGPSAVGCKTAGRARLRLVVEGDFAIGRCTMVETWVEVHPLLLIPSPRTLPTQLVLRLHLARLQVMLIRMVYYPKLWSAGSVLLVMDGGLRLFPDW
jgi:hypothetical protein